MKYYFITYQAKIRCGDNMSIWNRVIDISPMEFIKRVEKAEEEHHGYHYSFTVCNTCEITKEEYNKYKDEF
tara:strand:- start:9865 stop:10077 length:213 start_codon:yes stop_codon:yes gene_type:complete